MRTLRLSYLQTPSNAHPLVKQLFAEMRAQRIGICDLAERAGINRNAIADWRGRKAPIMQNLEACFNVLGFDMKVVRRR